MAYNGKEIQEQLNKHGYNLNVDGIVGPKTTAAIKDFQTKNGLQVDGIVGTNTWGALTKAQTPTATAPAKTETKAPSFTYEAYKPSDAVTQAEALLQQQLAQKPGEYSSPWQAQLDDAIQKIMNREKFSYDLNGDALYQQYKDQYTTQGKLAMMDTMGQAAAMTGGYGNSYAQSVGQQAYQGYLQQLNDKVPELYQLALNQYNKEGDDMYNQASLIAGMEEQEYGRYRDSVSDYNAELARLAEDARYKDSTEYGRWSDKTNLDYGIHRDSVADDQWSQSFQYQKDRDAVADSQWQKTFDEGVRQFNTSQNQSQSSGSVTDDISKNVLNKAAGYTNNTDLAGYLDGLVDSGVITEEQADALYAENKQADQAALDKRSWTLVDGGGVNWLWGVDNNAVVKDQYGNEYRLDKLVDALVAEGMDKKAAKNYVKNLQSKLGA